MKRTGHLHEIVKHIIIYYTDIFNCGGKWYVKSLGENKTKVSLDGYIDIKMPIFGAIAERIIARYLLQNLKKAERNLKEFLEEKYG